MMNRFRPELMKGLGVLGLFLALTIVTSFLLPYPISYSEYTFVDLNRVTENPAMFDFQNISSKVTVESLLYMRPGTFVFTSEGVTLQIRHDAFESPEILPGDHLYVRGTFRANQTIIVHEFYRLDYSSSIIRSIPGIIIFIVMFFYVFTIDFKHLAIIPRRRNDA